MMIDTFTADQHLHYQYLCEGLYQGFDIETILQKCAKLPLPIFETCFSNYLLKFSEQAKLVTALSICNIRSRKPTGLKILTSSSHKDCQK